MAYDFPFSPVMPESRALSGVVEAALFCGWLFLLLFSPFFIRMLRGVALAGWIIGFGILACVAACLAWSLMIPVL